MTGESFVGVCPGCGSGPRKVSVSDVTAVVENGTTEAICAACVERITAKRVIERQRRNDWDRLTPEEREAEVKRLRSPVPAPAAPAPAAPTAQ